MRICCDFSFQPSLDRNRVLVLAQLEFVGLLGHEKFAATDFSSLRCAYSGSAPLAEETIRRWKEATGTAILEGFGQTEAATV